ncbi:dethiobiotin synthase [Flavihumibacter sp. R14]|nr:dethiobiotin synthase [Flavihumibacter soli]
MKQFVIAGIGTEIGKTFISAILTEALEADYWKPVQAGMPLDTDYISQHISNTKTFCYPEGYRLKLPMSPHAAAATEGLRIDLETLKVPETANHLIIELAGGIMVPLNSQQLNTDLISMWGLPVILVSQNYLGSINHTLLSVTVLKQLGIRIAGIIFNGESNPATEEVILGFTGLKCIAKIPRMAEINKEVIKLLATQLKPQLIQI